MNRVKFWPAAYLFLAACGSAAIVGTTDQSPLSAVDGHALPATITDGAGASAQVISGSLTTYSWTDDCNYKINLASGKSVTGIKQCNANNVTVVTGGIVRIIVDAVDAGGPSGAHSYDFQTDPGKPCQCGRLCVGGPCGSDRVLEGGRVSLAMPADNRRSATFTASQLQR